MSSIGQAGKTRSDNKSFNIKSLKLVPSTGMKNAVDVTFIMHELNLYESIYTPVLSGDLNIGDSNDLIKNGPITGFEYLVIEFGKPGTEDTIKKTFRVFKADDVTLKTENMSHQSFTLNFCSEELVLNSYIKVSKSYKGKLISDIVNDMLMKQLKVPSKRIEKVETTTGIHNYVIPYYNPIEAINWVTGRTVPTYVFYENMRGFNFISLKTLLTKKVVAAYAFGYPNVTRSGDTGELNPLLQVVRYEYLKNSDSLSSIQHGMFGARLLTVDPLTRKHEDTLLDYKKEFGSKKHVEGSPQPLINGAKDRFGKAINEYPTALTRLYVTDKSQPNPSLVEQWMVQKDMTMNELNYFKLKLVIPGNLALAAGDLISFTVPSMEEHSAKKDDNSNPYHSGNYLITALRHKFNFATYEMVIEGTRDCTTKALPGAGDLTSVNS